MTIDCRYDILIVGGYGHVGLPLGIALADAEFQVALYDIDKTRENLIMAGMMPFLEHDAEMADTVIITIGTPVDEYLNPKLLPMLNLGEQLALYLRPGHHVMLRSTVYPGTSQRLNDFFEEHGIGLHFSFCPERLAQGYAIRELRRLPQIISGFSEEAVERSGALFARLGLQTIVISVKEAELVKLFSNAWRYIQFATANQFYMMATEAGTDFTHLHHAMTCGYERAQDFPTAGFTAGPCLLKDTMQLSAFYQNNFLLGHAAMLINEGLPSFIVNQLQKTHDLWGEVVGILGMAFKADVDDIRDSLSYKLGKLLRFHGAKVLYSDEFVNDPTFISKEELIARSSIVILGAPHSIYRTLSIPERVHLIDVWGFFKGQYENQGRF